MSDEPASESKIAAKERRRYEEHRLYVFLYTPDYAKMPPKEWPFACVVALRNDEKVINNQWCCLHVFVRRDGTFDFAEGMFATESEVTELYGPVLWPEIARALAVTPQAYRAAFGTKPGSGEMRFERIERWHRHGHSHPKIDPNAEGRVLKALCVTKLWDEWTAARERHSGHENWTFASCLKDLYEPKKLAALGNLKESHGNQLKQFCHELGLKPFQPSDFKSRMTDLEIVLTRIRDKYQITYQKQQVI